MTDPLVRFARIYPLSTATPPTVDVDGADQAVITLAVGDVSFALIAMEAELYGAELGRQIAAAGSARLKRDK